MGQGRSSLHANPQDGSGLPGYDRSDGLMPGPPFSRTSL
jgi:hypothetical protein